MKNPLESLIGRRRAIAVARAREMARARREDFPAANIPSTVGRFMYQPNVGLARRRKPTAN